MREMSVELVWLLSTHDIIIAWLKFKVTLKNGMYEVSGLSNYIICLSSPSSYKISVPLASVKTDFI